MRSRVKRNLHWSVRAIFDVMEERKLGFPEFSTLIEERTGVRIPPSTMKYWYYGNSTPKIDELEHMAAALEYELELIHLQEKPSEADADQEAGDSRLSVG